MTISVTKAEILFLQGATNLRPMKCVLSITIIHMYVHTYVCIIWQQLPSSLKDLHFQENLARFTNLHTKCYNLGRITTVAILNVN